MSNDEELSRELESWGEELEENVFRELHRDLAEDHNYLGGAGITAAMHVRVPKGVLSFMALSDAQQVSTIDAVAGDLNCTASVTSEGDGPLTVHDYNLQRGRYALPGKPVVMVDVVGFHGEDTSLVAPVFPGVVGYTAWTVGQIDTTTEGFNHICYELDSAPPPPALGTTADLYTVATVSAYEATVTKVATYTKANGGGCLLHRTEHASETLKELQNFIAYQAEHGGEVAVAEAFEQVLLRVEPLQEYLRMAVTTVTGPPELP